jgi:hypothetical protein
MTEPRTAAGRRLLLQLVEPFTIEGDFAWPREAILAIEAEAAALDVERLARAIYAISIRHDWEHTTDRDDRTEEIAAEYARLAGDA